MAKTKEYQSKYYRSHRGEAKGEVSFEKIVSASSNFISFDKTVSLTPDGYLTESGKKRDLQRLIEKYNVTDVVVNMYRGKSGSNDLKRMEELGFEIRAHHEMKFDNRPSKDYFYMKKKKKT